jgi:hypothetical protein
MRRICDSHGVKSRRVQTPVQTSNPAEPGNGRVL